MIKLVIVSLLSLITVQGVCQPLIDSYANPLIGSSYNLFRSDTTSLLPGNSGANQNWTFNIPLPDSAIAVVNYLSPSNTPYASDFPSANLAVTIGNSGVYGYYKTNADSMALLGSKSATSVGVCTNPVVSRKYTLHYLESFIDSSTTQQTSGRSQAGSRTVTYDGYGTLTINGHTFNNVIRLHSIDHAIDTYGITSDTFQSNSYEWLEAGTSHVLLQINTTGYDGGGNTKGDLSVITVTSYALD